MADANQQATAVARPLFKEVWKAHVKEKRPRVRIFVLAIAFFGAALFVSLLLPFLEEHPMANAARESLIATLMKHDFTGRPQFERPKIDYVAIPVVGCEEQYRHAICAGAGITNVSTIASAVELASKSEVRVLIVDAAPGDVAATCDDGARRLLKSITKAVDSGKIVIMPRPLNDDAHRPVQSSTFFDLCRGEPQVSMDADSRIFYGNATLEKLPESGGVYGLMRTSTIVDMSIRPREHGVTRETPNLAIVAILALAADSPEKLRATFDEAGLETRPYTTSAFGERTHSDICDRPEGETSRLCFRMDPEQRTRFRYGLDPDRIDSTAFYVVFPSDFGSTVPDQEKRNVDLNLIAADPWSTVDSRPTAVGNHAGGVIIANQIYAGVNDLFLEEASFLEIWRDEVVILAITVGVAALAAFYVSKLFAAAAYNFYRKEFDLAEVVFWSWSISIIAVTAVAAIVSWNLIQYDFGNGLVSFAFIGVLLSLAKCVFLIERLIERLIEAIIERFSETKVTKSEK